MPDGTPADHSRLRDVGETYAAEISAVHFFPLIINDDLIIQMELLPPDLALARICFVLISVVRQDLKIHVI